MNIFLDNAPVSAPLPPGSTVASVVDGLRRQLAPSGRLIVTISADGREVASDAVDSVLAAPVTDFERLDFASADPAALVRDILADAAGAFDRTRALRARIADDLSEGRTAEALASLTDCFTVWSRTHETLIKSAALLGVDLNAVDLDGRSGRDRLQNVADALRQLRDALDAGDHVLLADILRYELDATMDDWQRLISALSSHADSAHSSAGRRH